MVKYPGLLGQRSKDICCLLGIKLEGFNTATSFLQSSLPPKRRGGAYAFQTSIQLSWCLRETVRGKGEGGRGKGGEGGERRVREGRGRRGGEGGRGESK